MAKSLLKLTLFLITLVAGRPLCTRQLEVQSKNLAPLFFGERGRFSKKYPLMYLDVNPNNRNSKLLARESSSNHMIRLLTLALFLAFTWTAHVCADERPSGIPLEARWVKVERISDGDTIVLMDRTRVRLFGLDAPERDQLYGAIATAALERMVGRSVYLVERDEDRYGRLVAQLYHSKEGYDINVSMVCAGYAWWYEHYAPESKVLNNCQREAQQAPKGLWGDADPMPPWEWRRR